MDEPGVVTLSREQARELEKLRGKAERSKLSTLREGFYGMAAGGNEIPFLRGLPLIQEAMREEVDSSMAHSALKIVESMLRERMDQDQRLLQEILQGQSPMDEERNGTIYQRRESVVEDGVLTETFAVTHKGRKPRVIALKLAPGELSNEDLAGALECIYSILMGTDSGKQLLDARSTVKVQEIIANEDAPLRLKGIALYSNFDHTLYNINWSEDPRILFIDVEPFLYRKDRIKHYEREMAKLFEVEIRGY